MRRVRPLFLLALLSVGPGAFAQFIPWTEPPQVSLAEKDLARRSEAKMRSAAGRATPGDEKETAPVLSPSSPDEPILQLLSEAAASILLSAFAPLPESGAVRSGTSWVGQVTQNANSITVGGSAADDNGWGAGGLSLNASAMTFLSITAQRDAGNQAPTLFIQFEDRNLRTTVFSVDTSLFALGLPSTVQIPLANWTIDFGATDIASWSIGGGSVGTVPFRMTFDEIRFTTTAIPEPSTYAAIFGALSLVGAAVWRRRVRRG
jgi:hypothetical protein